MELSLESETKNTNYQIYTESIKLPTYHYYGQGIFNDGTNNFIFPDCVENVLLQFIKTLCWNSTENKFDSQLLPGKPIQSLVNFINELTVDNDNSVEMKTQFINIVSNVKELRDIYKNNGKYEIISTINNFIKTLTYLFRIKKLNNDELFKKIKKKLKHKKY